MIELVLGFSLGYFSGRFITMLGKPRLDRLLVWDESIFAWRGVPFGSRFDTSKKYLAATEVLPNDDYEASKIER